MNGESDVIHRQPTELHQAEPFEPFRIKLLNGDGHNVGDPRTLVIGREFVWVFSPDQHWAIFPIFRINSMESLVSDFRGESAEYEGT